ncbi:zinc finger CCCH-type with G patch domain-containing protein-like [Clytia hemisphaerica]|uniref:zinc finger CCCH-type with G patch domain-containing protein-like n=1 Tax=Clytia hemisphaerica TaxID=252671 RepID=UPI0034D50E47
MESETNEASLEAAILAYQEQLEQIGGILPTADELTKLELYDLEKDLKELISVTQEQLLTLKKESLLKVCEDINKYPLQNDSNTKAFDENSKRENTEPTEVNEEHNESEDIICQKYRVKYTQEWGTFQFHNVMLMCIEEKPVNLTNEEEILKDEVPNLMARVLFLNPIHKSMVTCKFYLDGKCNYADDDCRFSHGFLVPTDELQEYKEPDFTKLYVGEPCLAKFHDGVWYKAKIDDMNEDEVTVSFDTKNESKTVDYHEIVPLEESSSPETNSENESESDNEETGDGESFVQLSYKTSSMTGPLGIFSKINSLK